MRREIPTLSADERNASIQGRFVSSDVSVAELRVATRRYHFHGPLLLYLVTTVVLVFGAINGQNNLLFWLFGLAVGGLIVSGVLSGSALMGLHVTRIAPSRAQVDSDFVIRYEIRYRGFLIPACALIVEEIGESFHGSRSDFQSRAEVGAGFVHRIEPRDTVQCFAKMKARRRGIARFGAVRISTTFPFGLTRKSVVFKGESHVIIRPSFLRDVRFPSKGSGQEREGFSGGRDAGREGEFFALREFAGGDTPRDVAWRPSARVGVPLVRSCTPPRVRRELIEIDSCPQESGFDAIVSAAATLAKEASIRGIRFAIATRQGHVILSEGTGSRHLCEALDRLAVLVDGAAGPPLNHRGARRTLVTCDRATNSDAVVVVTPTTQTAAGSATIARESVGWWSRVSAFVIGGES